MRLNLNKNILMVSNYSSDTEYAWWLMEHFWCLLIKEIKLYGGKAIIAYPEITKVSSCIIEKDAEAVQLQIVRASKDLKHFIQENNIKIVYFTDRAYFNVLYFYLRRWGVKTIIVHDHTPGDRPPVNGFKRFVKIMKNKLPMITADAVLNVSELIRQRSIQTGCVPASKTFTVQNGIVPITLSPNVREKKRAELGVDKNSILIMTTGRAHPYKRFDFIIQVANILKKKDTKLNVHFFLIGDGPQFSDLKEILAKNNLTSTVHLLGYCSNISELLQAGDIGFHASLGEAFSLSIVEYMSAKLPVFVPNISTVCQAVTHYEDGCIYPWNDPEAAADMLVQVITDPNLLQQMGEAARNKASKKYSLDECSRQFLDVTRPLIFD